MNDILRLFIAIDLPSEVKSLLTTLQSQLRPRTDAVRWSDPGGTHLTLKFLGNVELGRVNAVADGMSRAAQLHQPFHLHTGALGVFPNRRRPRVLWLGVEGDVGVLSRLQSAVEQFVAPLGFPSEQRPFSPHLTLGRSIKEPSTQQLAAIGQAVEQMAAPEKIGFVVNEVVLMRSELSPRGAKYTALHHARLDGST
jgi:2'-5' RNA ligase